jgi:hypothetical protein
MPSYSIQNHKLSYNGDFSVLTVKANDDLVVATFNLSSAHSLFCADGDYDINAVELGTGLYEQQFSSDNSDTWEIAAHATDHLGVTDLRIERLTQFTYNLAACPVKMKFEDGLLKVYSPCLGNCSAPSTSCCTLTEPE